VARRNDGFGRNARHDPTPLNPLGRRLWRLEG
jgi:hypothetical protein